MKNRNNVFTNVGLITKRIASELAGFGIKKVIIDAHTTNVSDREAIASDWQAIGKDMRKAIVDYDRNIAK